MEIKNENMCNNEVRKAGLLLVAASELGMNVSGYGELSVNYNNGNVYLWLEDYPFSLYIGLGSDRIIACWSSFYDGREEFFPLGDSTCFETLRDWAECHQIEDARAHDESQTA